MLLASKIHDETQRKICVDCAFTLTEPEQIPAEPQFPSERIRSFYHVVCGLEDRSGHVKSLLSFQQRYGLQIP